MNKLLSFFAPNDNKFFELFETIINVAITMSEKLLELVDEKDPEKRAILCEEISRLEEKNDSYTHDIHILLGKNFITPFDREDIHALVSSLDDICDYIYSAGKKIVLYRFNPNSKEIHQFCEISLSAVQEVQKAILNLSRRKDSVEIIKNCIIQINSLENEADDLYDENIQKCFDFKTDVLEIVKRKDIYQLLEVITDKCEDAGNVIESIMIKYL